MKKDKLSQGKNSTNESSKKNKNNKNKSVGVDQSTPATDTAKPRAGHGLSNEGTVVSYEEER
ncbi:MAG: hypothetical protein JWP81_2028 [Ferruginibacter sp.]|nr:hypothetical protein [Ferruginibacter sp.]